MCVQVPQPTNQNAAFATLSTNQKRRLLIIHESDAAFAALPTNQKKCLLQRSRVRILHLPQWSWCAAESLCNNEEKFRVERVTYPWKQKTFKKLKFHLTFIQSVQRGAKQAGQRIGESAPCRVNVPDSGQEPRQDQRTWGRRLHRVAPLLRPPQSLHRIEDSINSL